MPPNVAIVVLDTLRKDYFQEYFSWLPGTLFTDAYSTSHWTIPAHASLLTGFYPSELGVTARSPTLDCNVATLPELLQESGYKTRMFTTNPQLVVWDGWSRGFDEVVPPSRVPPEAENTFEWNRFKSESSHDGFVLYVTSILKCIQSDSPTLRSIQQGIRLVTNGPSRASDVKRRIQQTEFNDGGEFLLVNLMDSHTPYDPPGEYATVDTPQGVTVAEGLASEPKYPDVIRQAYRDSVRYLADEYREIHGDLEQEFDYVITLSDHGELLGEDSWWNHGIGLRPELCQVPLNVSGEGIRTDEVTTPVSLLDVPATIAEITGIEIGRDQRGVDLLSPLSERKLLTEFHGLLPFHYNQFERYGVVDRYDEFDQQYDGIVTKLGYAYRSPDGTMDVVGNITDPEGNLNELRDEVPRAKTEFTEDVSDGVEERLRDLGYA